MKAEDWKEIRRNKWGFLDEVMMTEMFESLPILVWDSRYKTAWPIDQDCWEGWLIDVAGKPHYSHYLPIVLP